MKKLTTSVLAVVLSSSFAVVSAQTVQDTVNTQDIEGVVVTALGIKRDEKSLSYATQTVKAKDLNLTQNVDVKGAIAGKVAGVQINGQAGAKLGTTGKLRLRGAISLTEDADPIYVLDGIVVNPDFIDMDNIESVNVLKGPNATALYGTRALYGVVVMSSKKGSRGKVNVELNSTVSVDVIARTMKYQNEYGAGYEGENSMAVFEFDPAVHPASWAVFDGKNYVYGDNSYADASWGAKLDGREYVPWYSWWTTSPYYGKTATYDPQPDNVKDFYDKAISTKNTVSVSGGNDFFTGRVSFTNLDQNGITPYTYLKRNYFSYNGNIKFTDKFSVDTFLNYTGGKVRGEMDDTYGNQTTGSFNSWFDRSLEISKLKQLKDLKNDAGYHASWNWWGPDYYGTKVNGDVYQKPAFWYNPYTYMELFDDTTRTRNYSFNVAPSYKITNELTARVSYSRTDNTSTREYFMPSAISNNASGTVGGYMNFTNGFGVINNRNTEEQFDGRLSYSKKFDKLDVNAFVGGNVTNQGQFNESTTMNVWSNTQSLIVPDVYNFANSAVRINPVYQKFRKSYKSLYSAVSIGYNDIFYIDVTGRNDIISSYLNTDNSFFTYSVGGSLLVHNLLPKNNTLSYIKARAGFAKVPSDIGVGATNPQYSFTSSINGNVIAYSPLTYIDPSLKASINENFEAGLDLKFFNNRLSLSGTYYNENKNDEPIPVTAAASSGVTAIFLNSGIVNRKGVELSLSGDVIRGEDFTWTTSLNFAKNKTMVEKIADGLDAINFGSSDDYAKTSVVMKEGQEWGQLVGNGYLLDGNGNKVINADGTYAVEVGKSFGSVLPEFTGGFYNTFSYKGVSLSAAVDFQKGGKFFSLSEMWADYSGLTPRTTANGIRENGVSVVGVDASGTAVSENVEAQSYFGQFYSNSLIEDYVHDASYIKLREVALNYQLPKTLFTGTGIAGLNVGVFARNPWLIAVSKDNTHKVDPSEVANTFGDNANLPSVRSYGVNVKINF